MLSFPSFNLYSTPLLVLVLQGLIFAVLLLVRYKRNGKISDLFLALALILTCYHRTSYTIGFMDWYDTFRNTKINYYLISLELIFAPLLYFYVKSITDFNFKLRKQDYYHFMPGIIFIIIKLGILAYDSIQPGFSETQNGYLVENFQWKYLDPLVTILVTFQMLLYLAFTFQLYYIYRQRIHHFFSNTFKLELNWIRNFLFLFTFLFLYSVFQLLVDVVISELSWTQNWWYHFFSALVIIYVGMMGYFTNTSKLSDLDFKNTLEIFSPAIKPNDAMRNTSFSSGFSEKKEFLSKFMKDQKPYLNPDLNLIDLAKELNMSRAELSEVINSGFQQNFNDFINQHRVDNIKELISQGKHKQLTLLGVAIESGFNSKATFNRVFKKLTHFSPSEYLKTIK